MAPSGRIDSVVGWFGQAPSMGARSTAPGASAIVSTHVSLPGSVSPASSVVTANSVEPPANTSTGPTVTTSVSRNPRGPATTPETTVTCPSAAVTVTSTGTPATVVLPKFVISTSTIIDEEPHSSTDGPRTAVAARSSGPMSRTPTSSKVSPSPLETPVEGESSSCPKRTWNVALNSCPAPASAPEMSRSSTTSYTPTGPASAFRSASSTQGLDAAPRTQTRSLGSSSSPWSMKAKSRTIVSTATL